MCSVRRRRMEWVWYARHCIAYFLTFVVSLVHLDPKIHPLKFKFTSSRWRYFCRFPNDFFIFKLAWLLKALLSRICNFTQLVALKTSIRCCSHRSEKNNFYRTRSFATKFSIFFKQSSCFIPSTVCLSCVPNSDIRSPVRLSVNLIDKISFIPTVFIRKIKKFLVENSPEFFSVC